MASGDLKRTNNKDSSAKEKLASLEIAGVMNARRKIGMGLKEIKHESKLKYYIF